MLFSLKKIISLFFMPMSIGFLLFLLGILFLFFNKYKKAKIFLSFCFLWMFLISYEPFANYITKPLEQSFPSYINIDKSIKYVLVLGNGHNTNDKISITSQLASISLSRLTEGVRIYKQLDDAKLIVSGYGGNDITPHAIISKKAAISLGIKEDEILTQELAKDTVEEAFYAKKVIGDEKFVLVTSATHMKRAMKIFNDAKMNPIAAPTDYLVKSNSDILSFPKASAVRKTEISMHEYLGIAYYKLTRFIKEGLN